MLKDADGNDVTSGTITAFTDPPVYNIPFTVVGDNTAEENKKITITMTIDGSVEGVDATVSGAISVSKTIQIVNDDADPEIQFSQATASVTEGSSTDPDIVLQKVYSGSVDVTETITLAVTKAGSGDRTATDNSDADGDDYDVATTISTISFGASDASKVITVNADNDDYYEQSEVTFTIGSVVNEHPQLVMIILY